MAKIHQWENPGGKHRPDCHPLYSRLAIGERPRKGKLAAGSQPIGRGGGRVRGSRRVPTRGHGQRQRHRQPGAGAALRGLMFLGGRRVCGVWLFPSTHSHTHPLLFVALGVPVSSPVDFNGGPGPGDPTNPGSRSGWALASPHPYLGAFSWGEKHGWSPAWPPLSSTCHGISSKGTAGQSLLSADLCRGLFPLSHLPLCLAALNPFLSCRRPGLPKAQLTRSRDLPHPKSNTGQGQMALRPTHCHKPGPCRHPWLLVQRGGNGTSALCVPAKNTYLVPKPQCVERQHTKQRWDRQDLTNPGSTELSPPHAAAQTMLMSKA